MQNKNIVQLHLSLHQPDISKINAEVTREESYKLWKVQHDESRVTTLCTLTGCDGAFTDLLDRFARRSPLWQILRRGDDADQWRRGFSAREEPMLARKTDLDVEKFEDEQR